MNLNPERCFAEWRHARDHGDEWFTKTYRVCARHAEQVRTEVWPDRADREQAGLGVIVAAAMLAKVGEPSRDAPVLAMMSMFGLALVEAARAEGAADGNR